MNSSIRAIIDNQLSEYNKKESSSNTLLDNEHVLFSYNSQSNNVSIQAISELNQGIQYRLQLILPYLQNYLQNHKPKSFDLVIALGDILKHQYSIPSICFSRDKNIASILIPNIDFFTGAIYEFFTEVDKHDMCYNCKSDSSIFIGSSTGEFKNNTRIRFCKKVLGSQKHKAYIHNLCQANHSEWISEYGDISDILHSPISITEQLKHKIVVNIDGNTMCWSRFYWQMRSNSVPIYIEKSDKDIQFFDYIEHSRAYISCSLDDSVSVIDSVLNTDSKTIEEINKVGKEYVALCFDEYMNNPKEFLINILDYTLNSLIHNS